MTVPGDDGRRIVVTGGRAAYDI
ncbi:MAG: hypothetical protein QOJ69_2312, partial [Actinomycetota bacterium]|nr:hypothetical protein [Actinomycetota bacterium]